MSDYVVPRAPRITRFEKGKTYLLADIKASNEAPSSSYLIALIEMLKKLEENAAAYYAGMGYDFKDELERGVTFGEKWDKVWIMRNGKKANIVCHIDANTGLLYKPNGIGAPYPKPRADMFNPETYEYADPYGGWMYANYNPEQSKNYRDDSNAKIINKGRVIMSK